MTQHQRKGWRRLGRGAMVLLATSLPLAGATTAAVAHSARSASGRATVLSHAVRRPASARPGVKRTSAAKPPVPAPGPSSSVPFPAGVTPHLAYSDDFSETTLGSSWKLYDGPGNAGFGLRRPSAISLDGQGHLVITASEQNGLVVSDGMALRMNQTYGRFEFRVRTDADPSGITSGVVLTWPQSENWPIDGESDMYETLADPLRRSFQSAIHFGATNQELQFLSRTSATQWHTIVMDWSPTRIAIYRDGALAGATVYPAAIPHVPQHLCIQLDATNAGRLSQPVHMDVDYVKVYSFS